MEGVRSRLLAGGADWHQFLRVECILRESHELGDLVLLARPSVARATEEDHPPNFTAAAAAAIVVLKSQETLLQPRHVDFVLQPSTRFSLLSQNDMCVGPNTQKAKD